MKLVSYIKEGHEQLAILVDDRVYDADEVHPELPSTMGMLLNYWEDYMGLSRAIHNAIVEGRISSDKGTPLDEVTLLSPITQPASLRIALPSADGSSLFFGNHHGLQGPGVVRCMPDHFQQLDFLPGLAIVISRQGRNIPADAARDHIGGYMIMSNFVTGSPEGMMLVGANVAGVLGPWLVTSDDLEAFRLENGKGFDYGLTVTCRVNGGQRVAIDTGANSPGFAGIIERCSYGADLYPGDIICISLRGNGAEGAGPTQLAAGDEVEVEIDGLGKLQCSIVEEEVE